MECRLSAYQLTANYYLVASPVEEQECTAANCAHLVLSSNTTTTAKARLNNDLFNCGVCVAGVFRMEQD